MRSLAENLGLLLLSFLGFSGRAGMLGFLTLFGIGIGLGLVIKPTEVMFDSLMQEKVSLKYSKTPQPSQHNYLPHTETDTILSSFHILLLPLPDTSYDQNYLCLEFP